MEKLKPNFTQTPNVFYDEIMADLGHAELKCLLYIFRRTYGFHKQSDRISLSQFVDGIEGLDKGTGLAKKNVYPALESLVEKKLIKKDTTGNTTRYSLYLLEPSKVGTQSTQTRYEKYPEVGTQSTIQKKEKESIQKKELVEDKPLHKIVDESKDSIKISEIIKEFENVNPACKRMYGNTTQRQAVTDLIDTYTYDKVVNVIRFLPKSNNVCFWKATTPKQLWDNWANIQSEITSKFNKEATKKNNVAF